MQLLGSMLLWGTRVLPARSTRAYPTARGSMQVEEMEALVRYAGGHYIYWNLSLITHWGEAVVDDLGADGDAEEDPLGD